MAQITSEVELKELTDEQKDKYLENSGACPHCGSEDIEANDEDDYDGDSIYKRITCLTCGQEWDEIYELAGILGEGEVTTTHILNNAQWKQLETIAKIAPDYRTLDGHNAAAFIRIVRDIVGGV